MRSRPVWSGCRRPRSTADWRRTGRSCRSGAGPTPSRGLCSRTRSRSGPGRNGTTHDRASWRSTWSPLHWCEKREITFTRSRPGHSNDGAHVEQKNWAIVRTVVGYHRYDTPAELLLLNEIWALQSRMTNYFYPQQKLVSKVRDGAKITKKYDRPATPAARVGRHSAVTIKDKKALTDIYPTLNPAAIQRKIQALTAQLLTLTTAKARAVPKPPATAPAGPASGAEQTTAATLAS